MAPRLAQMAMANHWENVPRRRARSCPSLFLSLPCRGHQFGTARMATVAGEFRQLSCIVAIGAAIFFAVRRCAIAGRMGAFVFISHCFPPSGGFFLERVFGNPIDPAQVTDSYTSAVIYIVLRCM